MQMFIKKLCSKNHNDKIKKNKYNTDNIILLNALTRINLKTEYGIEKQFKRFIIIVPKTVYF